MLVLASPNKDDVMIKPRTKKKFQVPCHAESYRQQQQHRENLPQSPPGLDPDLVNNLEKVAYSKKKVDGYN